MATLVNYTSESFIKGTPNLGSASDWLKHDFPRSTTNQKHHPDLGGDTSSVWKFLAFFFFSEAIVAEKLGHVVQISVCPFGANVILNLSVSGSLLRSRY